MKIRAGVPRIMKPIAYLDRGTAARERRDGLGAASLSSCSGLHWTEPIDQSVPELTLRATSDESVYVGRNYF